MRRSEGEKSVSPQNESSETKMLEAKEDTTASIVGNEIQDDRDEDEVCAR